MSHRIPAEVLAAARRKAKAQVGVASFDETTELTILGDFTEADMGSLQAFLTGICGQI